MYICSHFWWCGYSRRVFVVICYDRLVLSVVHEKLHQGQVFDLLTTYLSGFTTFITIRNGYNIESLLTR